MNSISFFIFTFICYVKHFHCKTFSSLSEQPIHELSFDQINTLSINSEDSFPIKAYIPLPKSHTININIKFKKFEYTNNQITSENDFQTISYIVNNTFITELQSNPSILPENTSPITAQYYLAETTAFLNINTNNIQPEEPSSQDYIYLIITKNENNTNIYNSILIDIFCHTHDTIAKFDFPINYYFFGSMTHQNDSTNDQIKMIYTTNLTNFNVELIERGNNATHGWTIEQKSINPRFENDSYYDVDTSATRGINRIHYTTEGLVTIYLSSYHKQNLDYMIKFEQYNENDNTKMYSPEYNKTMYDDQLYLNCYNLFYNNTDIYSVSYVIKAYAKSTTSNDKLYDSPFNFYQGEDSELTPDLFAIQTYYQHTHNNKEYISLPLTVPISEFYNSFYFYINVHYRTITDSIERTIMYDVYSFSTITNEAEEIMFDQLNEFLLYEEPFAHPLIVRLPNGTNKHITYYNKYHSFEYKSTLPFDAFLINEEIELTTTLYLVNEDYVNALIADPTIDLPKEGIIANEFREEHVSMIELDNINEDYLLIVMNMNQTKIQLFEDIIFNIYVTEDVGKSPKWVLPIGYYTVGDFITSKRKMYTLTKDKTDDMLYEIEVSLNEPNPNFNFIIEKYNDTPTFNNDTSIIANVTRDIGKIVIIVESDEPFIVITLLDESPSSSQSTTKYNIKYVTGEDTEDLPFFYYDPQLIIEQEYEMVGTEMKWAVKTESLYAEYSDIVNMVNIYRYYKQSTLSNFDKINNVYLHSQNDDTTLTPAFISRFEPYEAKETIVDSNVLPSDYLYVSLLCKIDSIFGEHKLLYEIQGFNATRIPFEYVDFNEQYLFTYTQHVTDNALYMYTEVHGRDYTDISIKWLNVSYEERSEFEQDLFDVEVYFTNYTYIKARGLNDTTPLPSTKAFYGEQYPFERMNHIRIEQTSEYKRYDFLYIIIKQSENNKQVYSNYTIDVKPMLYETRSGLISYADEYYVYKLRPRYYMYFTLTQIEKVMEFEFGVKDNNPNISISFETRRSPNYQNDTQFIIRNGKDNKIILTNNNGSDINRLSLFVYHRQDIEEENDIDFYFKYKTYQSESEIIEIKYSNEIGYDTSTSLLKVQNVPYHNKNLNITEMIYEISAYDIYDVINVSQLNSLYILNKNEIPLYNPVNSLSIESNDNDDDSELLFTFEIPENKEYYFILRAFGLLRSGERFKLKYDIKFVNTSITIDFPMITKDNILTRTYTNTSSTTKFTPFYFYIEQENTTHHNYEVVFKYKCKYHDKQITDNTFNITSYVVDKEFIERRKQTYIEPPSTVKPHSSVKVVNENMEFLEINFKHSYIIIDQDKFNRNVYDSVEFSIYINDKDSDDDPTFTLPQNEYYYGRVDNVYHCLSYKLGVASNEHKYMKIEIIQNADDNDFQWEIEKFNNNTNDNNNNNDIIIKSNTTSHGKSIIMLAFNNQIEPYEIILSLYRINSNLKSDFLVKYTSVIDESNFNTYSYDSSKVKISFDSKSNDINFTIPCVLTSSQQIVNNIEYYLRGFNKATPKTSIDTLFISDDLLRVQPLFTQVIKPTLSNENKMFNYTFNLNNTIDSINNYYFTLVAVVYDNEGNKIDMLGYDVIEFNANEYKQNISLILFIVCGSIGGIFVLVVIIMYCSSRTSKKHKINDDNNKEIDGLEGPIAPKDEDNELGEKY